MTHARRYHKKQQKARQRRLQKARERLQREQARAERVLRALEQAVQELGVPEPVAAEGSWHLQAQQKLLGKILGMMFPPDVWLSQLPRVVSGARLGQEPAWPTFRGCAQAKMGQAPAAPGPGGVGAAVATRRV